MAASFPPDIVVLDSENLLHARLVRGKKGPRIVHTKSYRLAGNTFVPAVVTPQLTNRSAIADVLRRLRVETGRWDRVSVLLPDSWFRMNILELPTLPEAPKDAEEMVRWSLKRTMPIDPTILRIRYEVLSKTPTHTKVLTLSAIDETLTALEQVFAEAEMEIVLIESIGMSIWNAVTTREANTARDRIFFYIREGEFTTAAFRGTQPLFIRSRNLNGERTIEQEIKLSASYLRDTLRTDSIQQCYLSGSELNGDLSSVISTEFGAPVHRVSLADFTDSWPEDVPADNAELAACTGVFTA